MVQMIGIHTLGACPPGNCPTRAHGLIYLQLVNRHLGGKLMA